MSGWNRPVNSLPGRVAVVTNSDEYLFRFRAPLLKRLVKCGVKVFAVAPSGQFTELIESMGVDFIPWRIDRRSVNPLAELRAIAELAGIYKRVRPHLVQHFTVKPNLYGSVAARIAGVPLVVCGVTGSGYAFSSGRSSRMLLRTFLSAWYKFCCILSDRLTFQTEDDVLRILGKGALFASKAKVNPGGSGVDIQAFNPGAISEEERVALRAELGVPERSPVVTMASRLLWDKGVAEYVEAARMLKINWPDACFLLAGSPDPGNPGTVQDSDVVQLRQEGWVRPVGHISDMPALLSMSDVVVLPTVYPEGIPRVVIEAAAMARPVVATDIPGVRAIIDHEVNGLVIPPRDAESLASAVDRLLSSKDLRLEFGRAGRSKAEQEFDDRRVAEWFVQEYHSLWQAKHGH